MCRIWDACIVCKSFAPEQILWWIVVVVGRQKLMKQTFYADVYVVVLHYLVITIHTGFPSNFLVFNSEPETQDIKFSFSLVFKIFYSFWKLNVFLHSNFLKVHKREKPEHVLIYFWQEKSNKRRMQPGKRRKIGISHISNFSQRNGTIECWPEIRTELQLRPRFDKFPYSVILDSDCESDSSACQ